MRTLFGFPILNGTVNIKACKAELKGETLSFYENYKSAFIILGIFITSAFLKVNKTELEWIYPAYFGFMILLIFLYSKYKKILKWRITEEGFIVRYSPFNSFKSENKKRHLIEWNQINQIYLTDIFQPNILKDGFKTAYTNKTYNGIIIELNGKHKTLNNTFFQSDFLIYPKKELESFIRNFSKDIEIINKETINGLPKKTLGNTV